MKPSFETGEPTIGPTIPEEATVAVAGSGQGQGQGKGLSEDLQDKIKKISEKVKKGEKITDEDFKVIIEVIKNGKLKSITTMGKKCGCLCTPIKYLGIVDGWDEFPYVTMTANVHIHEVHEGSTDGWVTVDTDGVTDVSVSQNGGEPHSGSAGGSGSLRIEVHEDNVLGLPSGLGFCQRKIVTGTLKYDNDGNGFLEIHLEDPSDGMSSPPPPDNGSDGGSGDGGDNARGPGAAEGA
jgi:hypothetical protein